jgi:hypothetical protein
MLSRTSVVIALSIVLLGSSTLIAFARDGEPTSSQRPLSAVGAVTTYFATVNVGGRTGNFSQLSAVVASHAHLTRTDALGRTKVYDNLSAIRGYYQDARARRALSEVGIEGIRLLSTGVVIAYTRSDGLHDNVASRSVHVFIVSHGMIVRYDWVVLSGT